MSMAFLFLDPVFGKFVNLHDVTDAAHFKRSLKLHFFSVGYIAYPFQVNNFTML